MIVLVLMFAFNSQACDLHTRQHPDKPPYAQTISRLYVSVLGSIDQVLIVMLQFDQVTILHRPFPSGVDSGVTVWSGHNIAQTISQWCISVLTSIDQILVFSQFYQITVQYVHIIFCLCNSLVRSLDQILVFSQFYHIAVQYVHIIFYLWSPFSWLGTGVAAIPANPYIAQASVCAPPF